MSKFDPWKVLGVKPDASDKEIKIAFRALAAKYHPDRQQDAGKKVAATKQFQEITRAYEAVKTPQRRTRWAMRHGQSGFSDSFAQGPRDTNVAQHKNEDITFAQAFSGTQMRMYVENTGACERCNGRGCVICGNGTVKYKHPIRVQVPPGVVDGQQLRVASPGLPEIVLTVRVKQSKVFKRLDDPADLLMEVPITFAEATLGTSIKVPTPTKIISLRIPSGTEVGKTFRIAGQGMPRFNRTDERGDLYIRVTVFIPDELNAPQRKLIEQLAMHDPKNLRVGLLEIED